MPRRRRNILNNYFYHILNRASSRLRLFDDPEAYDEFCELLVRAVAKHGMKVSAYCIMPNHWHLIVKPDNASQLASFVAWLTTSHVRNYHQKKGTVGHGPIYQGRFKCFPIESVERLNVATRYVERNAVTANLIEDCRNWKWSSVGTNNRVQVIREEFQKDPAWPIYVNKVITDKETRTWLDSIQHQVPYGSKKWIETIESFTGVTYKTGSGRPVKKLK